MPRGTFADVQGQHCFEGAGVRPEYLHGALAQMTVFGHEQHQVRHQSGTSEEGSMGVLIVGEIGAGETIAQQQRLPESEAESFSGNGVDPSGRVSD